ncbi:tRNA (cytidine(34)-2'-O)-methyltransferase [Chlamydiales bacterium]|nr:tRNA (cytidine(34)-2'-O)-methyltransferase [Chlamydiales bacterium]
MKIVLFEPKIPQNAGNIVRTCSVTGTSLVLVRPLGFSLASRYLKRAGLDYWDEVDITVIDSILPWLDEQKAPITFFSSHSKKLYTSVSYKEDHILVFGSETEGLPLEVTTKYIDQMVKIPMLSQKRCLNLATSVGIGLYHALSKTSVL